MRIECDDYTISYAGGRLADIEINGRAVEAVPVRSEGSHGFSEPEPSAAQVLQRVKAWIDPEDMPHYREAALASANAERAHERECHDPRCHCGKRRA